jgi:hypothetical protein
MLGSEPFRSEIIPITNVVTQYNFEVPFPDYTIEEDTWMVFAQRIKEALIFRIRDLVRQLSLESPSRSAFVDWNFPTRHAILVEIEQAFLDPKSILREYGPVPGFYAFRQPDIWEEYQEQIQDHLEDIHVQQAFDQLYAKLISFPDLSSIDWVINPEEIEEGKLGKGLTFFQEFYTAQEIPWQP